MVEFTVKSENVIPNIIIQMKNYIVRILPLSLTPPLFVLWVECEVVLLR